MNITDYPRKCILINIFFDHKEKKNVLDFCFTTLSIVSSNIYPLSSSSSAGRLTDTRTTVIPLLANGINI